MRSGRALLAATLVFAVPMATASGQSAAATRDSLAADSLRRASHTGLPPAGYGTLHQADIALAVQSLGVTITAIPLDESVIRTLAPDSYRSLHDVRESKSKRMQEIASRTGSGPVQAWYVTFFNADLGEARYEPGDFSLRSAGRDYRPIDILGLKSGWGDGRLPQKGVQVAIYLFDSSVDLTQPITMTAAGQQTTAWSDILQRIERERAFTWARAQSAAATKKP